MSDYEQFAKGPLKLKKDSSSGKKKKKEKMKEKEIVKQVTNAAKGTETNATKPRNEMKLTKAELAFMKQQEKMKKERILQMASMTHKQRVEEFNRHLDSLTEHFDIPKVSWTK